MTDLERLFDAMVIDRVQEITIKKIGVGHSREKYAVTATYDGKFAPGLQVVGLGPTIAVAANDAWTRLNSKTEKKSDG